MNHQRAALFAMAIASLMLPAAAQAGGVAYEQSSAEGTTCNYIPLGEDPAGQFLESRTQLLIPAPYLPPTGGVLSAIRVFGLHPAGAGSPRTIRYGSLEIRLAHRPHGAGSLSRSFAANLGAAPALVLAARNLDIVYEHRTLSHIAFTQPFAYDGRSDLVIEIRKLVQGNNQDVCHLRNDDPPRLDLPPMIYAFGAGSSQAAQATTSRPPLRLRLRFDGLPVLRLRSDLGPGGMFFEHGTSFDMIVDGAPNTAYFVFLQLDPPGAAGFLPAPWTVPGLGGGSWLDRSRLFLFWMGWIPSFGQDRHRIIIPRLPALVGWRMTLQAVIDGSQGQLWTCATDAVIN